jgi:lipid-A-disaccharide synthase-like uncharacterized protein
MNSHIYEFLLFGNNVVVTPWKIIGMVGALMFASRWFVQAYYSRKAGRSVTPRLFWVMSMVGSVTTLAYFVFSPKQDMVGVIQNLFPFVISAYNLYLDANWQKEAVQERVATPIGQPRTVTASMATPEPVADA